MRLAREHRLHIDKPEAPEAADGETLSTRPMDQVPMPSIQPAVGTPAVGAPQLKERNGSNSGTKRFVPEI